jgi:tyrosyl-tRNA synthetase
MMDRPVDTKELLSRGVAKVVVADHLTRRLGAGDKLTVKLGIDPTGAELHLGHAVVLRKLRDFAAGGHKIVLIIGDFTAQVGDPSDLEAERQPLTKEEISANMTDYIKQVEPILGKPGKGFEVRYNSEWLDTLGSAEFIKLMGAATLQQVTQRDDFHKRMDAGKAVSMTEVIYSLLQGYDSVAIGSDLEVGGADQELNLLMGRQVQKRFGKPEQDVMTFELLEGTDGRKMSKSYDNFIALRDEPADMYGKIMRVHDDLVERYFLLCTDLPESEITKIMSEPPRSSKARLAEEIVAIYHGPEPSKAAEAEFNEVFRDKGKPSEIPAFTLPDGEMNIVDLLEASHLVASRSEARRLIDQGGVRVDDQVVDNYEVKISSDALMIQVGKRRFLSVR